MKTRLGLRGRLAAVACALVVSAVGLIAPAHADLIGDIDTARDGNSSVILHKRSQPNTPGTPATGNVVSSPAGEPINGVGFTLYRVEDYNLGTAAGWTSAQPVIDGFSVDALDSKTSPTQMTVTGQVYNVSKVGSEQTTAGEGVATFSNLPLGLYLVVETSPNKDQTGVVLPAAPFLVTTPYHASSNSPWIYDVNVYPKNSVTQISKEVTKESDPLGKGIEFTIRANVPAVEGTLNSYKIVDTLDNRLTYSSIKSVTNRGELLSEGTDYEVSTSGQTVTVTFTNPGSLVSGNEIVIILVADVNAPGNGTIPNTVVPFVNDNEGKHSNEVTTEWGQLKIFKYATVEGQKHGLKGAKFELYTDAAATANKVETGELVSNADGVIEVPVLKPGTYYLKETEAPAGYTLLDSPITVVVKKGEISEVDGAENNFAQIENTKQDVPGLPNTGANGALYLTIGGISLLALAVGGFFLSWSRKRKQE